MGEPMNRDGDHADATAAAGVATAASGSAATAGHSSESVTVGSVLAETKGPAKAVTGRSPGQIAWLRLKRDRAGMVSLYVLVVLVVIALLAPLISKFYGDGPSDGHSELLDLNGIPLGYVGGVSGDHWLGVMPQRGQDLFMQLIYGMRTSLGIALFASIISLTIGVIIGITAGYARGWLDKFLTWLIDVWLSFPFFLFALAIVPVLIVNLQDEYGRVAFWKKLLVIMSVFFLFNWTYPARIVRGQVISLREREYVEAAKAAGAGLGHILFKQLLPNLWAPILVAFSLAVPTTISAEAALAIFGVGIKPSDDVADLGQLVNFGVGYMSNAHLAPLTVYLPGTLVFVLVLCFNLFGDALRDALDPRSLR
ncbi:MAG: ABC transporter permease [Catenulispora sp.]|nr:ABC transporter permease [Catenulispora sp.]